MNTIELSKKIYVEPKYLDKNIKNNFIDIITNSTKGECTKKHGYIVSIDKITSYTNLENTIFIVNFEATSLKPIEGCILSGDICMLYNDGIFINVMDYQKVLVPSIFLTDYEYDEDTKTYTKGDENVIKEGDTVNVKISAVKYSNKKFICYGSLA